MLPIGMALACAACSQEEAPADDVVAVAEEIVAPSPRPTALAKGKWAPQDTCSPVEGADAFRANLAEAIKARDEDALVALAAEDVKLDFGGGTGKAELRARLLDPSRELWQALDELTRLGCSANEQGGITIPWYFDQNLGTIDPFEAMLVTGEDIPVLAEPTAGSEQLGSVSWDFVTLGSPQPDSEYQQVEFGEEQLGYVRSDRLRSVIDYRLIASSRNGRWRITMFTAGD